MAIQVKVKIYEGKAKISLNGRFDFNSHQEFRSGYEEAVRSDGVNEVEVDLGGVDYMDSSALGMLLLLKEKATMVNKKVVLENCRGTVLQILEIANFQKLFTIK